MRKILSSQRILIVMLVFLIGLPVVINAQSTTTTTSAKEAMHKQRCINWWNMEKSIKNFKLTQDQEKQMDILNSQTKNALQPLLEQVKKIRPQLQETFLAATIDTAKANAQIQQIIQCSSQMMTILLNAKTKGAQVLTPEQRAQLLAEVRKIQESCEKPGVESPIFPDLSR